MDIANAIIKKNNIIYFIK